MGRVSDDGGELPGETSIGLARSQDGITWAKAGQVLQPELCGGTAADFTAIPRLLPMGDSFILPVVIGPDIAALRSLDNVEWTCVADGPVFAATEIPGNERVHTIAAAEADGRITVLIEALIEGGSELWLGELTGLPGL